MFSFLHRSYSYAKMSQPTQLQFWELVVGALSKIEGAPKIFRKLLQRRNQGSGNIKRRPENYSNFFLVFLTFAGLYARVLR